MRGRIQYSSNRVKAGRTGKEMDGGGGEAELPERKGSEGKRIGVQQRGSLDFPGEINCKKKI